MLKHPEGRGIVDVVSAAEVARAAAVPLARVKALIAAGGIRTLPQSEFFSFDQAVAAVRALNPHPGIASVAGTTRPFLFDQPEFAHASKLPIAISSTVHAGFVACVVLVTSFGLSPEAASRLEALRDQENARLVFLIQSGPGGGGGGGGLRQRTPPPRAQRKGVRQLSSPLPAREEPKPIAPVERPADPPPPPAVEPEPLPPVVAPVASAAADPRDRAGVIDKPAATDVDSRGPGVGGGTGDGRGTGLGSGDGSGIGEGSGGGTGGGPYQPGSGVTPPRLLHEVKADYTEVARQRSVEGEVVMEITVRRDGSVGDVRLVRGLSGGLNERAMQAVRQWTFAPARRLGQPVDVVVEVVVEFKLR